MYGHVNVRFSVQSGLSVVGAECPLRAADIGRGHCGTFAFRWRKWQPHYRPLGIPENISVARNGAARGLTLAGDREPYFRAT